MLILGLIEGDFEKKRPWHALAFTSTSISCAFPMKRVEATETGALTRRIFSWVSIRPIFYERASRKVWNNGRSLGDTWVIARCKKYGIYGAFSALSAR